MVFRRFLVPGWAETSVRVWGRGIDVKLPLMVLPWTPPMTVDSVSSQAEIIEAELLAHCLRHVASLYDDLNRSLFSGRLRRPLLVWGQSERLWGSWSTQRRILELNPRLIDRGWAQLCEVLKHEMAHQFVAEVVGLPAGEGPHGPAFARVCRARGIDERASGEPEATPGSCDGSGPALLKKVEALLALASSDNAHEAEAAMAQARRLMLKYNLSASPLVSDYSYQHLGKPTGRRMAWQRALASILAEFFFVEIIVVPVYRPRERKRGSVLEACGTRTNLEIAAYAHDFLVQTGAQLWRAHKRAEGIVGNRERQSFLHGVMAGFHEKLSAEASKQRETGLVWSGDPELAAYFRRRHPHVRNVGGRAQLVGEAFASGRDAGTRIVFSRAVRGEHSGRSPRLLPGRGGG